MKTKYFQGQKFELYLFVFNNTYHLKQLKVIKMQIKSIPTQEIPLDLQQFDLLPNSAFIRLPTLKRLYGISAATCWRGVKNGTIPKPVKQTERCTCWNVGLIRAALAAKAV